MRPLLLGLALVLHACAQASAGTWATAQVEPWIVMPFWLVAMVGYLAAGFAVLGLERLRCGATAFAGVAAPASLALYWMAGITGVTVMGMFGSVALAILVRWWARCTHPEIHTPTICTGEVDAARVDRPGALRRTGAGLAYMAIAWTALLVVVHPWHRRSHPVATERPSFRTLPLVPIGFYLRESAHVLGARAASPPIERIAGRDPRA